MRVRSCAETFVFAVVAPFFPFVSATNYECTSPLVRTLRLFRADPSSSRSEINGLYCSHYRFPAGSSSLLSGKTPYCITTLLWMQRNTGREYVLKNFLKKKPKINYVNSKRMAEGLRLSLYNITGSSSTVGSNNSYFRCLLFMHADKNRLRNKTLSYNTYSGKL